jgi:NAD+ diphosphatase
VKRAEQVTFGGGGLERAAQLRGDNAAVKALWAHPQALALAMWRGKPLAARSDPERGPDQLALVPCAHPALQDRFEGALFLGTRDGGGGYFAVDFADFQPEDPDEEALNSFADLSEQVHPDLPAGTAFAELRRMMTRLTPLEAELAATAKALLAWHGSHGFCSRCGAGSEMSQMGWQRGCPACGGQHFPRTDPVVIMLITHGDRVLMGRSPGWPEGMFSLLAGFVEPGETLEAAVRREVFEEAGIRVGAVSYLSSQPWAFPNSLMFGCAGAALDDDITIDPAEIEEAMWVSRSEMMQAFAGDHPVLKPARKGALANFLLQNWLADTLD